ncbi:glutamate receptor ionotropic, kainate 1-like [Palaemon carinicauda]|uniref:glutamate receptor ionotropic, kainate 1-like n=1 Tax=Palaemon carinicauda TaxID=392227 RepID=UPI0035B63B96
MRFSPISLLLLLRVSTVDSRYVAGLSAPVKGVETTVFANITHQEDEIKRNETIASIGSELPEKRPWSSAPIRGTISSLPALEVNDMTTSIGSMAWQALALNTSGCHYALVILNSQQPLAHFIIRHSSLASEPFVVINLDRLMKSSTKNIFDNVWGGSNPICRAMLIDVTQGVNTLIFGFLETAKLWLWPDARIVFLGRKKSAVWSLTQPALRNTLQPLYLGLQEDVLLHLRYKSISLRRNLGVVGNNSYGTKIQEDEDYQKIIHVYGRCLYCNNGQGLVTLLSTWSLESKFSNVNHSDSKNNLQGTLLRVVSMPLFPYCDYKRNTNEPASIVTLRDSLDMRMLTTVSTSLNFSYEVRAPWDGQWGIPTNTGNWTGLLGTIQFNKADFTTVMSTNPQRNTIVNHERVYVADVMAVVSLKPQVLPPYLVIVKPFTVEVWLCLLISSILWCMIMWILQKTRSSFSGEDGLLLSETFFLGWAAILENPSRRHPANTTAEMMLIWWLLASLVIITGFKSSLVAYLTVQSKTKPIDDFRDLVSQPGWKWGIEKSMLTGGPLSYFKASSDPIVKTVYNLLESVDETEGLAKVLKGGYSFLNLKNDVSTKIASYHTDSSGRSPYYVSKHGHRMLSDFGWGFRKGAPFRPGITRIMKPLDRSRINRFLGRGDVTTSRVTQNRREISQGDQRLEG